MASRLQAIDAVVVHLVGEPTLLGLRRDHTVAPIALERRGAERLILRTDDDGSAPELALFSHLCAIRDRSAGRLWASIRGAVPF